MNRLDMLLNAVKTGTGGAFPMYGLALEYRKLGRDDEAKKKRR